MPGKTFTSKNISYTVAQAYDIHGDADNRIEFDGKDYNGPVYVVVPERFGTRVVLELLGTNTIIARNWAELYNHYHSLGSSSKPSTLAGFEAAWLLPHHNCYGRTPEEAVEAFVACGAANPVLAQGKDAGGRYIFQFVNTIYCSSPYFRVGIRAVPRLGGIVLICEKMTNHTVEALRTYGLELNEPLYGDTWTIRRYMEDTNA